MAAWPENSILDDLLTAEGRSLVAALTPYDPERALVLVERARADPTWAGRAEVVAAAATQARLRTRAAWRFPGPPRWWTPDGLEQATRPALAARHAARYAGSVRRVVDLGCGAGSDTLAMAARGIPVLAVDRDPDALWALTATARDRGLDVEASLADVEDVAAWFPGPDGLGCFVDPARRSAGARALRPDRWSPPWQWVVALAERVPATGAKVAPGIPSTAIPRGAQVEWTSVAGHLLEAAVWWGPLRRGGATRSAVVLHDGQDRAVLDGPDHPGNVPAGPDRAGHDGPDHSGKVTAGPTAAVLDDTDGIPTAEVGALSRWLVEPDAAVIRSGLVSVLAARIGGRLIDPHIAYIVADRPSPSPFGSLFEVLDEIPFARKRMRAWLRAHGFGDVVVKKRGLDLVPDQVRADLRLAGDGPTATLLLTRTAHGPLALHVRRIPAGPRGVPAGPGSPPAGT